MKLLTRQNLAQINGAGSQTTQWKNKAETDLIAIKTIQKKAGAVIKQVCGHLRSFGKIYIKELEKPSPYNVTCNPYVLPPIFTTVSTHRQCK